MRRVLLALAVIVLAACTPTFNWREVHVAPTPLVATLPCKPETAEHDAEMLGKALTLHALGCKAGGATFAILWADEPDASRLDEALAQWEAASLSQLGAKTSDNMRFRPAGSLELPHAQQEHATGHDASGHVVQSQATYFAQGSRVYQALVIAPQLRADMTEPFFSGLRFQ